MQPAFVRYELNLTGAEVSAEQARQMLEFGAVYGYPEFEERALACGAPADGIVIARYSFPLPVPPCGAGAGTGVGAGRVEHQSPRLLWYDPDGLCA